MLLPLTRFVCLPFNNALNARFLASFIKTAPLKKKIQKPSFQHFLENSILIPASTMTSRFISVDLLHLSKFKLHPSILLWNKNLQGSNTTRETIHSAPFKTTKLIQKMKSQNNNNKNNKNKNHSSFHPYRHRPCPRPHGHQLLLQPKPLQQP